MKFNREILNILNISSYIIWNTIVYTTILCNHRLTHTYNIYKYIARNTLIYHQSLKNYCKLMYYNHQCLLSFFQSNSIWARE